MICRFCGCRLDVSNHGVECSYCDFESEWDRGFCDVCESFKDAVVRFKFVCVCKECLKEISRR